MTLPRERPVDEQDDDGPDDRADDAFPPPAVVKRVAVPAG
jgi:hypothetical protein